MKLSALSFVGVVFIIAGVFCAGYWYRGANIPEPKQITVTQSVNIDSIKLSLQKTLVSKESFDSVATRLEVSRTIAENDDGIIAATQAIIDSLKKLPPGTVPDIENFTSDTTKEVPIRLVTVYDDSTTVDTLYARVSIHQEFYGEPFSIFHDLRIRTFPLQHSFSYRQQPEVVYSGRGLYVGGDISWLQGDVGIGIYAGIDKIRLGATIFSQRGTMLQISADK